MAEGLQYPIIDMHSHVLPGVDDGARTMEESLRLLEMAHSQGIDAVFATPHYTGHGQNPDRTELRRQLEEKILEKIPGFCIYSGHENFYHEGLVERLRECPELSLAGSPYVLVEFDPAVSYGMLFRGIRRIAGTGSIPLLAHVERYLCLRKEEHLAEVAGCGCRFQMNFDSLQGHFFSADVRWCRKQVLSGRIFVMGTDMHRLDFRPPAIKGPLSWLMDHVEPAALKRMLYENPMNIIEYKNNDRKKL